MMKHLLAKYNLSETNMARDATGIPMRTSHILYYQEYTDTINPRKIHKLRGR